MPTEKERAEAAEILAAPSRPAPPAFLPTAAMLNPDSRPGQRLNPDYVEWSNKLLRKLVAVAVLFGVDAKENVSEMNWYAVALGLAVGYHPSFKPRKDRGRTRTKYSDSRYEARISLLRLVNSHLAKIVGRKSVEAILPKLRRDPDLPQAFKGMRPNTLRQEITIAKRERQEFQRAMADLLRSTPNPIDGGTLFGVPAEHFAQATYLVGAGLRAKPIQN